MYVQHKIRSPSLSLISNNVSLCIVDICRCHQCSKQRRPCHGSIAKRFLNCCHKYVAVSIIKHTYVLNL